MENGYQDEESLGELPSDCGQHSSSYLVDPGQQSR